MTQIWLMRHGQASLASDDYDQLSELGKHQAKIAGGHYAAAFDVVICGAMKRHRQTAEAFANAHGALDVAEVDDGWNEYDHRAVLAIAYPEYTEPTALRGYLASQPDPGRAFNQLFRKAIDRWIGGDHDADYPESYLAFCQRVRAALDRLGARLAEGQRAIVFTSGGPVMAVCQQLLEIPPARAFDLGWAQVNTGLTKLHQHHGQLRLSVFNQHTHLGEDRKLITYL